MCMDMHVVPKGSTFHHVMEICGLSPYMWGATADVWLTIVSGILGDVCMCMCMYVCVHIYMYCVCVCAYVRMCVHVCTYVCVHYCQGFRWMFVPPLIESHPLNYALCTGVAPPPFSFFIDVHSLPLMLIN